MGPFFISGNARKKIKGRRETDNFSRKKEKIEAKEKPDEKNKKFSQLS